MACHGVGPGCTVGCTVVLWGYVDGMCGGCCYGVSLRWCDGGISLDGEEEVVAVHR